MNNQSQIQRKMWEQKCEQTVDTMRTNYYAVNPDNMRPERELRGEKEGGGETGGVRRRRRAFP